MTEPQHMVALAKANAVLKAMREVKREVAAGLSIADALEDERSQRMPIFDLLCAQHRWGPRRARQILSPLLIGERRLVRDLTDRQRRVLVEDLSVDERERRQRRRDLAA